MTVEITSHQNSLNLQRPSILIVDDYKRNLIALSVMLEDIDANIISSSSGEDALKKILSPNICLVLLDVQMPEMDGFEVAELMRKNKKTSTIPIIFVTAINKDNRHVFKGYETGAVDFLYKPIENIVLQSKVKTFIDLFNSKKEVEEKYHQLQALRSTNELILQTVNEAIIGFSKEGKLNFINKSAELLFELNTNSTYRYLEDLFFDKTLAKNIVESMKTGLLIEDTLEITINESTKIISYSATPIMINESEFTGFVFMARDISEQELLKQQLRKEALHDSLTQIGNRKLFDIQLPRIIKNHKESGNNFALLFIDLDKFKYVNDNYGHNYGDEILINVANTLKSNTREGDLLVRFGGDEFALVITGSVTKELAKTIASRIIQGISKPMQIKDKNIAIGACIGIALYPEHSENNETLMKLSDDAMYQSKNKGGNQYTLAKN
jgi:diguanylate cyclase (GGDEF)-like protein